MRLAALVGVCAALWGTGFAVLQATGLEPQRPPEGYFVVFLEHLALGLIGGAVYGALLPTQHAPPWWQRARAGAAAGMLAFGCLLGVTRWRLGGWAAVVEWGLGPWAGFLGLGALAGAVLALWGAQWVIGHRKSAAA
jgi:hypothetical protein